MHNVNNLPEIIKPSAQFFNSLKIIQQKIVGIRERYQINIDNVKIINNQVSSLFQKDYQEIIQELKNIIIKYKLPFVINSNLYLEINQSYIYYGERENDGNSLYIYKSGKLQIVKHRTNFILFPNQSIYYGILIQGKPSCEGTYKWSNSEIYCGEWLDGLKHGIGEWKTANGEYYLGEWHMGQAEGLGKHVYKNGDNYIGEFRQNVKHGYGIEQFSNGDKYIGNYYNGVSEGIGEYKWGNSALYRGNFKKGMREGYGRWWKGNHYYEGQYSRDVKNGYGRYEWGDGTVYIGEFKNDQREGFGEMRWNDGKSYKGSWCQNKMDGIGIMIINDNQFNGIWKNNICSQLVRLQNPLHSERIRSRSDHIIKQKAVSRKKSEMVRRKIF